MTDRMIFGVSRLTNSNSCSRVIEQAREMMNLGFDVTVLATEPMVSDAIPHFEDLALDQLPRTPYDHASDIWLSLIQYLEQHAPCTYITTDDRLASLICCRLSNRVRVIGILYENTQGDRDHCARLGRYWNAIVVRNRTMRQRIIGELPINAARLATIGESAEDFAGLIAEVDRALESGQFRRRRGKLKEPPSDLLQSFPETDIAAEVNRVNSVPMWPDWYQRQKPLVRLSSQSPALREHRIIFAVPTGRVSGVDIFSINLARELIARGYRAELVRTLPNESVADRMSLPPDVPAGQLSVGDEPTWPQRWKAMRDYLESRAPCIYIPNYDRRHSGIVPTLSSRVKVIGIGHSDDSREYDHIVRLASYWDAVVGVSSTISQTIASLAPGIETRQWTIPYGVSVPGMPGHREDSPVLRVAYAGRIVRFQKRALDLLSIARHLRDRGASVEITVAGTGADLEEFLAAGSDLISSGFIKLAGGLSHEDVQRLYAASDIFVLPSGFEGLPLSLLEAMANGCVPVVSAIRSGVPELIQNGESGFMVPIGDTSAFADRIMELGNDPDLRSRMRAKAYRTVRERYNLELMASAYLKVLESVVSKPFARPQGRMKWPPDLHRLESLMPVVPSPLRGMLRKVRSQL